MSNMPWASGSHPTPPGTPYLWRAVILALVFAGGVAVGVGHKGFAKEHTWLTGGEAVSHVTGVGSDAPADIAAHLDVDQLWDVWRDLKAGFYSQPVDDRTLLYGAIHGMTASLGDPYTLFFEPKEAEEFTQELEGKFSGIGAEIGKKNDQLQVVAPLPDSPAERAGVRARDLILQINGEESLAMPVEEAVSKIRGEKGTSVSLQLGRMITDAEGVSRLEPVDVTIVRDLIVVQSVVWSLKEPQVALVEIHSFNQDIEAPFRKAIDEALAKGARGIVLDLRNNPGGYLDQAVAVAGEWMPDDVVVMQRERGEITERYTGMGRGSLTGVKTVVLVNEGSASASEIVAGALQDAGAATIVGATTFGKGSVQDYLEYPDGSALKVTIAEWLTPNGRSIHTEGIQPDVAVELTPEDFDAERDPQLEKALELIRTGAAKP
ncbi:MAG: hypothetical protein RL141_264 [Candidatus Parcubacteria bacterium]|jgi:carboxyl-terminal processing protease